MMGRCHIGGWSGLGRKIFFKASTTRRDYGDDFPWAVHHADGKKVGSVKLGG